MSERTQGGDPAKDCATLCDAVEQAIEQEQATAELARLWEHAQKCPRCLRVFAAEAHLRRGIREGLGAPPQKRTNTLHLKVRVSLRKETLSHLRLTRTVREITDGRPGE